MPNKQIEIRSKQNTNNKSVKILNESLTNRNSTPSGVPKPPTKKPTK